MSSFLSLIPIESVPASFATNESTSPPSLLQQESEATAASLVAECGHMNFLQLIPEYGKAARIHDEAFIVSKVDECAVGSSSESEDGEV